MALHNSLVVCRAVSHWIIPGSNVFPFSSACLFVMILIIFGIVATSPIAEVLAVLILAEALCVGPLNNAENAAIIIVALGVLAFKNSLVVGRAVSWIIPGSNVFPFSFACLFLMILIILGIVATGPIAEVLAVLR